MKLDFDAELKLDFNSGERINLELTNPSPSVIASVFVFHIRVRQCKSHQASNH